MKDKIYLLYEATPSRLGEVPVLPNALKPSQRVKQNEETKECVPNKKRRMKPKVWKAHSSLDSFRGHSVLQLHLIWRQMSSLSWRNEIENDKSKVKS